MYLPSLQKNIQELDRQISLLETECEHMEADKREINLLGKTNSKTTVKESSNKPFITGPSISSSTYSTRLRILSPMVPKMYSSSCGHFRTMNDKFSRVDETKHSSNIPHNNFSTPFDNSKPLEKKEKTPDTFEETGIDFLPSVNNYDEGQKPIIKEREFKKPCRRSMSLIKEISESSDENVALRLIISNRKKSSQEQPKEQTWCELFREKCSRGKRQERNKYQSSRTEALGALNSSKPKFSSDEEIHKDRSHDELENEALNGNSITHRKNTSTTRRSRSARTKKNDAEEIPLDVNISKPLQEKEIQCELEKEEREKAEFLFNLNEVIKDLIQCIGDLKMKSSREKNNDVLNNMQNTLMKISKIKSVNTVHNPLNVLTSLNGTHHKLTEGEENILDLKETLLGIKKFCQELMDEKSFLTEELAVKNRTLASLKSKEKEYLSLISSLKFNLEKMKEEAEESAQAKRDLKFLKAKLQEETKVEQVIEALRKSHEKMQELIENYVLENDKLKTQVKITKLESQKFSVLLAGKEVEINKYKKEIESFQKQITEQLSLLRSKATENEIECALETISNQTNLLQTEVESNASETIFEKEDFNEYSALVTIETTSESFSTRTRPDNQNKEFSSSLDLPEFTEIKKIQKTNLNDTQVTEGEANVSDCATCKSNDLEPGPDSDRQFGLQKVLSSSKNLRSSINELLEDIRREKADNNWPNLPNSCNTSSQTTLITITSDDASQSSKSNLLK